MPFSGPGKFWKKEDFQKGNGKLLGFCLEKFKKNPEMEQLSDVLHTVLFMFTHFTIYSTKHNSPKHYTISHPKWCVSISMEFRNPNENEFHGFGNLVTWLWKCFGNFFNGVCTNTAKFSFTFK